MLRQVRTQAQLPGRTQCVTAWFVVCRMLRQGEDATVLRQTKTPPWEGRGRKASWCHLHSPPHSRAAALRSAYSHPGAITGAPGVPYLSVVCCRLSVAADC